ncbi:MAG: hypothetical protein KatS3mg102_0942 [Planctomycetota bacterium]|nr:MAG: hypothetical protein KatS3mg102_0942 [Planctomycetota bacterium]
MHGGAAQRLGVRLLAGRHLHQGRAGQIDLGLPLDHDHVVGHARDVGPAGGGAAEHAADAGQALARAAGEVAEGAPAGHEDAALVGQVGAGALDQAYARQPVLLGDLGQPVALEHAPFVDRPALHRRVVGEDGALGAADQPHPADHGGARHDARHAGAGQRRDLQEPAVGVEQPLQPLAREQLAARAVALDVALAAAGARARELALDLLQRRQHRLAVGAIGIAAGIELRDERLHPVDSCACCRPAARRPVARSYPPGRRRQPRAGAGARARCWGRKPSGRCRSSPRPRRVVLRASSGRRHAAPAPWRRLAGRPARRCHAV